MMADRDYAIGAVGTIPTAGTINKKPAYLIHLTNGKGMQKFVAIDKPDSQNGFISTKGFFSDATEEEIIKTFSDLLTQTPKELILDMWFPWHRVYSVRSLDFNANKLQTLVK
jgi:hypothetical protein